MKFLELLKKFNIENVLDPGHVLLDVNIPYDFDKHRFIERDDVHEFKIKTNTDVVLRLNLERFMISQYERVGDKVLIHSWKDGKELVNEFPFEEYEELF